jgi:hypothetical protein
MKKVFQSIGNRSSTIRELFAFLWENKLWWIIPFVVVLVLFGALVVFAQASPVSPFIYALF